MEEKRIPAVLTISSKALTSGIKVLCQSGNEIIGLKKIIGM